MDKSGTVYGLSNDTTSQTSSFMETPVTEVRSPGTNYHRIDLRATDPTEQSDASSPGTSSLKRFACQFDPGSKNGRVLVLLFDRDGDSEFKEMSRLDVLKMTQQAAVPREEELVNIDEVVDVTKASMRMGLGSLGTKGRRASINMMRGDRGGSDEPNYATVCDVQVSVKHCKWCCVCFYGLNDFLFV